MIGGRAAVSASVVATLKDALGTGGDVAGSTARTGTGRPRPSPAAFYPDRDGGLTFLATGANFPDALAVGPATRGFGPLLLTTRYSLPTTTATELQRLAPGTSGSPVARPSWTGPS